MRLILASASPRRLDLLAQIGVTPAAVDAAHIDESPRKGELPADHARRLSNAKAAPAASRHPDDLILSGATLVAAGRRIPPTPDGPDLACLSPHLPSGPPHPDTHPAAPQTAPAPHP